jgi:DNA-binding LacI/PurR family transcriptional regulator
VGTDGAASRGSPSIYDIAREAGVSPSTVSRALSKPGRVSFATAEHVRGVADRLGYRSLTTSRSLAAGGSQTLAMMVADITNPVFFGMIRGAERTAMHAGYTLVLAESQEAEENEKQALERLLPSVAGLILTSSRMADGPVRTLAKRTPLVVLNRLVDQVPSVACDNIRAMKKVVEHLAGLGHRSISYLAGPDASWANGQRWRGLLEAGHELDLTVRRLGPFVPTMAGGRQAAAAWAVARTSAVVAYNDLMAIGFLEAMSAAGVAVPGEVSVVGFDDIRDATLVRPRLTSVRSPLVSLGSAAVNHLLKTRIIPVRSNDLVVLPAQVVVRDSSGPAAGS